MATNPIFELKDDSFVIRNYNQARPFSSFLPGIAGPHGKPMWVFYANRAQCITSFGVRNKDGSILEFNPATKAYQEAAFLGFRTFIRLGKGSKGEIYEPFRLNANPAVKQTLRIRQHEIEIEETHQTLGISVRVVILTIPTERLPLLVRDIEIENRGRRPLDIEMVDGLPRIVPFGLKEFFVKAMTRTMEAFCETIHVEDRLPLFKMKVEPDDRPDVQWVQGGSFAFTLKDGESQPIIVDPENIFGSDTSFQFPRQFQSDRSYYRLPQRKESFFGSAFSRAAFTIKAGQKERLQAYYGQTASWEAVVDLRKRIIAQPDYVQAKRAENARLLNDITQGLALHTGVPGLDAYSRQTYLDNVLRGGYPCIFTHKNGSEVLHYYSRKHGDMERDYNFFELSPTYYSQGNGNFRDVNQNRRSEVLMHAGMKAGNVETFFNLVQLDGYNPLVLQAETFYVEKDQVSGFDSELSEFLAKPFQPGMLFEKLLELYPQSEEACEHLMRILSNAKRLQLAAHGEGYWVDHWYYSLDLLENFLAAYPDEIKSLMVGQRNFTYFDNDHVVQPRNKKYVRRLDGKIRQLKAVLVDPAKQKMIRRRTLQPNLVRTKYGEGSVYQTSLLVKMLGLIGIKLATLDPFGVGIEMEADKPGWCDALNGMPGLLGSSVNEAFELRRWIGFLQNHLSELLAPGESHPFPIEMVEFLKALGEALAISRADDFYKTWDTLASLRERFRERTRLGISGDETPLTREEISSFLNSGVRVLDAGLRKAFRSSGPVISYFINEAVRYEALPAASTTEVGEEPVQNVKVLEFKQVPVSPFLEGPMHALRTSSSLNEARKIHTAVRNSELYDRKLKMYRLNVPLTKESFEIGRNKIFAPGWLENESIFLHMSYKYLLEELRSGLVDEFFDDMKHQCVAFLDPATYGRSPLENSSFIVSSRFPDARLHGGGFAARLTGAAAEWISMVLYMGLGSQPFQFHHGELRFEPRPTLAGWLFQPKAGKLGKDTFGFKLFGKTWIVYHNPGRKNTYGEKTLLPKRYRIQYTDGKEANHEGQFLPNPYADDLRRGKLARVTIDLA
jgi:hypothetical protein